MSRGPEPGLCGSCRHARTIDTRSGSRFYLCELSRVDSRFPRYPRLPVLRCAGYDASSLGKEGEGDGGTPGPAASGPR